MNTTDFYLEFNMNGFIYGYDSLPILPTLHSDVIYDNKLWIVVSYRSVIEDDEEFIKVYLNYVKDYDLTEIIRDIRIKKALY